MSKSTGAKTAKAKHANGKSKSHVKKHRNTQHQAKRNGKRPSTKKADNAPIGLEAF